MVSLLELNKKNLEQLISSTKEYKERIKIADMEALKQIQAELLPYSQILRNWELFDEHEKAVIGDFPELETKAALRKGAESVINYFEQSTSKLLNSIISEFSETCRQLGYLSDQENISESREHLKKLLSLYREAEKIRLKNDIPHNDDLLLSAYSAFLAESHMIDKRVNSLQLKYLRLDLGSTPSLKDFRKLLIDQAINAYEKLEKKFRLIKNPAFSYERRERAQKLLDSIDYIVKNHKKIMAEKARIEKENRNLNAASARLNFPKSLGEITPYKMPEYSIKAEFGNLPHLALLLDENQRLQEELKSKYSQCNATMEQLIANTYKSLESELFMMPSLEEIPSLISTLNDAGKATTLAEKAGLIGSNYKEKTLDLIQRREKKAKELCNALADANSIKQGIALVSGLVNRTKTLLDKEVDEKLISKIKELSTETEKYPKSPYTAGLLQKYSSLAGIFQGNCSLLNQKLNDYFNKGISRIVKDYENDTYDIQKDVAKLKRCDNDCNNLAELLEQAKPTVNFDDPLTSIKTSIREASDYLNTLQSVKNRIGQETSRIEKLAEKQCAATPEKLEEIEQSIPKISSFITYRSSPYLEEDVQKYQDSVESLKQNYNSLKARLKAKLESDIQKAKSHDELDSVEQISSRLEIDLTPTLEAKQAEFDAQMKESKPVSMPDYTPSEQQPVFLFGDYLNQLQQPKGNPYYDVHRIFTGNNTDWFEKIRNVGKQFLNMRLASTKDELEYVEKLNQGLQKFVGSGNLQFYLSDPDSPITHTLGIINDYTTQSRIKLN